ncbi:MAG: DoxX-like family protein [Chitinophaga sp.]|uniref:DoxX-like family protein n=1 Tax=Chitinophaga sp. TaxID=1869181 RepID=UPI001B14B9D7|nr:DoxX-like family protein [Chitinophaga sp.]MBO9730767.1 DoxX-like family protein [Chitinophaga sp.]
MPKGYYKYIPYFLATVWIVNGLLCKVCNLVPRHQLIVARILGAAYAPLLTKVIGILELLMAVWILSRIKPVWCAIAQIILVMTMNIIEFTLAPDLLLFGRINMVIAVLFSTFVYWFQLRPTYSKLSS